MDILSEREQLLTALVGKRGFLGVRVKLGPEERLCVDVSPDADMPAIYAALRDRKISTATEIVRAGRRSVAKALTACF